MCSNPLCGTKYDVSALELRLVEMACRESTRYQVQDLRCSGACRGKVLKRTLSTVCDCCADLSFEHGNSTAHRHARLDIMCKLAMRHDMKWLEETTRFQLRLDGREPPAIAVAAGEGGE